MDTSEQVQIPEEDFELPQEMTAELTQQRRSQGRIIFDRFVRNRVATIGAVFLIILVICCLFIPLIPGHDSPNAVGQTTPFAGVSWQYPFGADNLGRDTFARAMIGGRISLLVALSSMLISILLGTLIGALAGYYGGWIDNILMRLTDTILTIPLYLLLFVLSATFADGTPTSVIFLIAIFGWTTSARLVRGEFLALKQREFVQAAATIGARGSRLMFYHILPNAAGPIIVNATLLVGSNIILESVLSFFGFGVSIPIASWGSMINQGRDYFDSSPLLILIPGILIFLTVLSCNLVGDGLRDALDPHMTER
ncbi:ABC transporter permease [Dictyobacter aurantiacus]|uniref:Oligopeptide transport system permease protein AppC n=1 Tax=Dictyobacter aurantiacus TaxID=1936993 RepID=A0A401ZAK8_9CHLR|nr:ABC transporter permease [Dictyobacter aurantiacus]GCE03885.1 oligopeptide transport system permease protein AppC [Dictyobacter aurantiacus]